MITKKVINIPIFRLKLKIVVVDDIKEALEVDPNISTEADSCVIDHNSCEHGYKKAMREAEGYNERKTHTYNEGFEEKIERLKKKYE